MDGISAIPRCELRQCCGSLSRASKATSRSICWGNGRGRLSCRGQHPTAPLKGPPLPATRPTKLLSPIGWGFVTPVAIGLATGKLASGVSLRLRHSDARFLLLLTMRVTRGGCFLRLRGLIKPQGFNETAHLPFGGVGVMSGALGRHATVAYVVCPTKCAPLPGLIDIGLLLDVTSSLEEQALCALISRIRLTAFLLRPSHLRVEAWDSVSSR